MSLFKEGPFRRWLRQRRERFFQLETEARVTKIDRECVRTEPHPDLIKYVPSTPKEAYICTENAGITGKSVGRPDWGYVGTITYSYMPEEGVGYIELIYVWEEFRRKGYGVLLINYALDVMRKNNIKVVYTAPVRKGSPELFISLNFRPFENTPLFYKYL
jgi:GNAT superfamily N-acetyltransferase